MKWLSNEFILNTFPPKVISESLCDLMSLVCLQSRRLMSERYELQ